MVSPSKRLTRLPVYRVAELAKVKRRLMSGGMDVIDLGAGDIDLPPPEIAVQSLREALADPTLSRYGFQLGSVRFREAVSRYMGRRFGVSVDPMTEVLPLIGSKEGLAHLAFALLDPGDVCIVPEPGYPPYAGGAILAGAEVQVYALTPRTGFLVELEELPEERLRRTKLVFLNSPNHPTGAIAPREYLERTVKVCRKYDIALAYDNPYCELTFDGYRAPSILEITGARDVAIEFHSISKSFAMTGWRLGWATGNRELVGLLQMVKTYIDTGAFLAVQHAAATLLDQAEPNIVAVRRAVEERRDAAVAALRDLGLPVEIPRAAMYLWIPLPGVRSESFANDLLEREGVLVLPGATFGEGGEGYFRIALTVGPERLREAIRRMEPALERAGVAGARS